MIHFVWANEWLKSWLRVVDGLFFRNYLLCERCRENGVKYFIVLKVLPTTIHAQRMVIYHLEIMFCMHDLYGDARHKIRATYAIKLRLPWFVSIVAEFMSKCKSMCLYFDPSLNWCDYINKYYKLFDSVVASILTLPFHILFLQSLRVVQN